MTRPAGRRSDAELLDLVAARDDAAFAELHRRLGPALLRHAGRLLAGTAHAPEDAVQDAFVRLHAHVLAGRRPAGPVAAWMHVVVRNRCLDLRRQPVTRLAALPEQAPQPGSDPAGVAAERDELRRLVGELVALPPRQRDALVARELGGASHRDIAVRLDTTPGAVKALIARARAQVVEAVAA